MARLHQPIASRRPPLRQLDAMREELSPHDVSAPSTEGATHAEPSGPSRAGGQKPPVAEELEDLEPALLQRRWRSVVGRPAPEGLSRQLMIRILVFREQIACVGDIDASTRAVLANALNDSEESPAASEGASALRPGVVLVREHNGALHRVMVLDHGYAWNGRVFASLSAVASAITGTHWNGPRFFGIDRQTKGQSKTARAASHTAASTRPTKLELGLVGKKD